MVVVVTVVVAVVVVVAIVVVVVVTFLHVSPMVGAGAFPLVMRHELVGSFASFT